MSYTALYRRYRPQRFAELVGQEHISRVLAAAVRRGEPTHAYLFCGPRGTGKTSAARILARAINCQQPTDQGEPCGLCPACRRGLAGESMDLIEIDGASNRSIDDVRDLRERVRYAPAQEKRKIYIVDEVHMLSNEAFNALLKTLEEPPEHVVFIFATTEPHKLPLTVISRCQRFDFRRISDRDVEGHLLHIAEQEHIDLQPEAAALIARKAEGGMRDAVSLLDQCAAISAGPVDVEAVSSLLGVVDRGFILNLLELLLDREAAPAVAAVEQLAAAGKDLRQALSDLQEALRDGLLEAMAGKLHRQPQEYLALLAALTDTDQRMRLSLSPRIALELALIRACAPPAPLAPPPEKPAPAKQAPAKPMADPVPAPVKPAAPEPAPIKPAAPAKAKESGKAAPAADTLDLGRDWPRLVQLMEGKNNSLADILRAAVPTRLEGARLLLDLDPEDSFFLGNFQQGTYKELTEDLLAQVYGRPLTLQPFAGAPRPQPPPEAPEPAPVPAEEQQERLF